MSKFEEIDAKILARIDTGVNTFALLSENLKDECEAIRKKDPWRVIDARLQALRKRGLIAWRKRGAFTVWYLLEKDAT